MTNNASIQEVLFFPQMKPEPKKIELTEEEKIVFDLLSAQSPIDLAEHKGKTGLSNKKWDITISKLICMN